MLRVEHDWEEQALACVCDGEAVVLDSMAVHVDQSFAGDALLDVYGTAVVSVETLAELARLEVFGLSPSSDLVGFNPVVGVRIGLTLDPAVRARLEPAYAELDSPRGLFDIEVGGEKPARNLRSWAATGIDQGISEALDPDLIF